MKFTKVRSAAEMLEANCIVKHYAGSRAYGTALPTSDTDFRGIFVADEINIRTPFYPVKEVDDTSEEDTKLFELFQFMKLALACNPNVIETLWVDQSSVVHSTPAYDLLREHRSDFMSTRIAFTTSGYAFGQLKRIKGHNKWINNPQAEQAPAQCDFVTMVHNFTESKNTTFKFNLRDFNKDHRLVPYGNNIFGLYKSPGNYTITKDNYLITDYDGDTQELGLPLVLIKFNKDVYVTALETWKHYWDWKTNRNVARSALEEQFGYDTKHAMHLVRLLRMGREVLETGELLVMRPDAQELLEIRNGKWTYEEVVQYADELDNEIKTVHLKNTSLPKSPNMIKAANIIMEVQDAVWKTK